MAQLSKWTKINALIVVHLTTTVALMQVLKTKNALGTISIAGQEYQVYLGGYDVNIINVRPGRGINGMLHGDNIVKKRKFTLIEV